MNSPIYAPPSICDDCTEGALEHLHANPVQSLAVYCSHHAAGAIHEMGIWRVIGPCRQAWFDRFIEDQRRVRAALAERGSMWGVQ